LYITYKKEKKSQKHDFFLIIFGNNYFQRYKLYVNLKYISIYSRTSREQQIEKKNPF